MVLSLTAANVRAQHLQLASYKKAADAFAKAHDDITKKLEHLGDRASDFELLEIIAIDVASIAKKGTSTAMTLPRRPPTKDKKCPSTVTLWQWF